MNKFHKWHKPEARKAVREVHKWKKHKEGWIKCNFDGVCSQGGFPSGGRGYDVMLRDHTGGFLAAIAGPVERHVSALHSELIAARYAVGLVKRYYPADVKVKFEGDSSAVMATKKRKRDDYSVWGSVINDLRFFLMGLPYSECGHVQREGHSVGHRLAWMGLSSPQEMVWFEEPTDLIQDILFEEGM